MPIKKILWPTDFSSRAQQALSYVTSLSGHYDAEIHILYVIEDLAHHKGWYGDFNQDRRERIVDWEQEKAKEHLEQICSNHLKGCPRYIRHVAVGDPAQEILNLSTSQNIDLIVMSTRGAKGHFSFGSVAEKVVKNARVPVVTIPPEGIPE